MSDLIDREKAVDTVVEAMMDGADADMVEGLLYLLPSAEPERKTGKWIKKQNIMLGDHIECSLCGNKESRIAPGWWNMKNYCPNCGADMRGGRDD